MTGVRGQLAGLVATTTSVVLVAFLVPLGLLLRSEAEKSAISTATLETQSLAAVIALNPDVARQPETWTGSEHVSVFLGGQVTGAPADRTPSVELATRGRAFVARSGSGVEVLVPVQGIEGGPAIVRSFVPEEELHAGVARTWTLLAVLGLVLFILGLLIADRLGRRLVGSVTDLAGAADRLSNGDLTARVEPSGAREIRRVGAELNRLAARIGELLAAQREDVADLAHRLRTPVTAVRLDVETVRDEAARARLTADVDALGRVVDEVIRTARRPVREGVRAYADLAEVAAERVAFWSALAEDTGRSITATLPSGPVPVRSAREDLVATLDALLENVFSHTPDDAAVRVEVSALPGGGGRLVVDDAGPGFAGLPERGHSPGGSTGLGLDIARRTAEVAGGGMWLGTGPLGGARVTIDLLAPA